MSNNKDPPDKYKVIKVPLTTILLNKDKEQSIKKLFDAVTRNHEIVIHVYQFLRLWILHKYHNNSIIPQITKDLIRTAFKSLLQDSAGPKPKSENCILYDEFNEFYEKEYKKLGYNKLSGANLSQILNYTATSILTCIENNIKLNFIKYVNRFINTLFTDDTLTKKELKKELKLVKEDMVNNTLKSDKKYHTKINKYRPYIIPQPSKVITYSDINNDPQQFLKSMIYMNTKLEKYGRKMFQFFPLRKNIIPKYIPIDTKSIVEILFTENVADTLKTLDEDKDYIWNKFFNMKSNIFSLKKYSFNYSISTDGYAVSLQFINNKYIESDKNKKELIKNGRKKFKEITKNMNDEEKTLYKKNKEKEKKEIAKEKRKQMKEAYNKLSKKEQKEFRDKMKQKSKSNTIEFPYLDELTEKEIEHLIFNCIYCDPGKRDLFTFIDDYDNVFTYGIKRRHHELKSKKYRRIQNNYKKKYNIDKIENSLSKFNSKSCNKDTFSKYIKNKNEVNNKLLFRYSNKIFRQYKWYTYINARRSEDKLLDEIEKKYGTKDENGKYIKLSIIMGDWSIGKQLRNFVPTPNIHFKRLLKKRFNVYNFDEFNTSKLHYKTEEKCTNMYVFNKNGQYKKIHSVLTYRMGLNRRGCINRDINGVKNIRKLANYWLEYNDRPSIYKLKITNPKTISV